MTWRERTTIFILLLVARMLADGEWADEIKKLQTSISVSRLAESA